MIRSWQKNERGMTLIEVLIALAIVGIAMTAVIKATSQHIRGTNYLQNKMTAMWVGELIMNEIRTGVRQLPRPSDKLKGHTKMLHKEWYWQAECEETPNKRIKQIAVSVYEHENEAKEEEDPVALIHLESYIYDAK